MTQGVVWPDQLVQGAGPPGPRGGRSGAAAGRDDASDAVPTVPAPSGRPLRRLVLGGLRTGVVLAGATAVLAQGMWAADVWRASHGHPHERLFLDETVAAPPASQADGASQQARAVGPAPDRIRRWADDLGPRAGVPPVALAAYGRAEVRLARERPGCHLSWVALAGIGRVESDHGRSGGATLGEDGRSTPRIVGVPLDGNGVAAIGDTDGGALDGDAVHDRAVGPMQFIPSTWRRWGADGDGDGVADPDALPDAALAAGRYLCAAGGGDLRTAAAWTRAVLAYNNSGDYLVKVTAAANGYVAAAARR